MNRWFDVHSYPSDSGLSIYFADISGRKRGEAQLQKVIQDLEASRAELQDKIQDLETFHDVAVGRELKMIELEKEIEKLKREHATIQKP